MIKACTVLGTCTYSAGSSATSVLANGTITCPITSVTLGLNAFRDTRSGSLAAGTNSYRAHGISFSATGQF